MIPNAAPLAVTHVLTGARVPKYPSMRKVFATLLFAACAALLPAQKRLVLIDEDGSGPGGSNQMAMLALLQSPDVQVLGITMVTGNAWRDEETSHTLRMLELTGHAGVPVARGAVSPLVRTEEETRLASALYGKVIWLGAWGEGPATLDEPKTGVVPAMPAQSQSHGPYVIPPMPEGSPTIKPIDEDAAHFLIRQVRAHPHQVTIYAAGPLTNIALAIAIDPEFASLAKGIVLMGGSLNPQTNDPEFATDPRHEFNFWFDPEAAHIVLRAAWPRIDVTTVDVSIKAPFSAGDARRHLEITCAGRALHRRMEPAALLHVGRARLLRVARSLPHHQGEAGLHGCGPEPRSQLRRHDHMG